MNDIEFLLAITTPIYGSLCQEIFGDELQTFNDSEIMEYLKSNSDQDIELEQPDQIADWEKEGF